MMSGIVHEKIADCKVIFAFMPEFSYIFRGTTQ